MWKKFRKYISYQFGILSVLDLGLFRKFLVNTLLGIWAIWLYGRKLRHLGHFPTMLREKDMCPTRINIFISPATALCLIDFPSCVQTYILKKNKIVQAEYVCIWWLLARNLPPEAKMLRHSRNEECLLN